MPDQASQKKVAPLNGDWKHYGRPRDAQVIPQQLVRVLVDPVRRYMRQEEPHDGHLVSRVLRVRDKVDAVTTARKGLDRRRGATRFGPGEEAEGVFDVGSEVDY